MFFCLAVMVCRLSQFQGSALAWSLAHAARLWAFSGPGFLRSFPWHQGYHIPKYAGASGLQTGCLQTLVLSFGAPIVVMERVCKGTLILGNCHMPTAY